eukprot:TRINITY_DN21680_c0_g1_i2.p1 TRINITY_DN21680_c0_g1~~TRINITY_DN21680_c0_g1_i2.p1  ORF type:complete len:296 (+),score=106.62 TRINITY_DN21680_c0_g1_i2:106-993(+)
MCIRDRNYYKSADVCQMAVFKETEEEANCLPTQLNSGLTPATKRIRKRRMRRNPECFEPTKVRDVESAIQQYINNNTEGAVSYEIVEKTDDEESEEEFKEELKEKQPKKKIKTDNDDTRSQALSGVTGLSGITGISGGTGISGFGGEDAEEGTEDLSGAPSEAAENEEEDEEEDPGFDDFEAELAKGFNDGEEEEEEDDLVSLEGSMGRQQSAGESSEDDSGDSDDDAKAEQFARNKKSLQEEIVRLEHSEVELTNNLAFAANPIMRDRFDEQLAEVTQKKSALEQELRSLQPPS